MSSESIYDVIPVTDVCEPSQSAERLPPVILVVDDERVIADTLSVILSRSGFSVLTAYDAVSALETAKLIPPHLLLTDVMMEPGGNGVDLAITMVKIYPECKVLLFSGCAATTDLLQDARKSGHDFTLMVKPVHPTDLLRRITDSLGSPMHLNLGRSPQCEVTSPYNSLHCLS